MHAPISKQRTQYFGILQSLDVPLSTPVFVRLRRVRSLVVTKFRQQQKKQRYVQAAIEQKGDTSEAQVARAVYTSCYDIPCRLCLLLK